MSESLSENQRAKAKKYYAGREIGILRARVETLQIAVDAARLVIATRHKTLHGLTKERNRMRSALKLIAGEKCSNFTSGDCKSAGRTKNAQYGADRWCDACIARDGLGELK